jgi:ketosteroid isomerase-like protein
MWKGLLSMPVGRIQLRTIEVDGNGETAWEEGRYTLVGANGATLDDGKYVVIWKHQPDGWKLYRDIWSSNTPQQAAPPGQPAAIR